MIESEAKNPKPLLPELIQHTVEKQRRGREFARGSDDEKRLATEVEALFAQREHALQLLGSLFPEGIPVGIAFFNRLNDLHLRLGWGEISHRATGLLLLLAVEQLPAESGEALLCEMPHIANPYFFQALESISVLVADEQMKDRKPIDLMGWLPPEDWGQKVLNKSLADEGESQTVEMFKSPLGNDGSAIAEQIEAFVRQSRATRKTQFPDGLPASVIVLACLKHCSPLPAEFWRLSIFGTVETPASVAKKP